MKSAIEIANTAELLPITEVARAAGILADEPSGGSSSPRPTTAGR
jgi:hypothetical protein